MNNNIDANDIKAFIAVVDLGTFTKAAMDLNVTKGHISKQIKKLEDSMESRLLNRTTRSLSLTKAGKAFYNESKASFTRLNQAIINTINSNREVSGEINVNSVGGIIGEDLLAPILAKFGVLYPDITINLDFSSTRSDLIGDKYDLIIRMGKLDDSNFMAKKIADVKINTLATPKYLNQFNQIKHPSELKKLNCLTGSIKRWNFINHKTGAKSSVTVSGSFNCPNGRSLLNAARADLGIVRISENYCLDEIKKGQLVRVMKDWSIEIVPVYAIYYSNKLQPLKMKLLIDFISSSL